jgi:DNA invertase Pin-like site-specific DNA recombinase
MTATLFEESNNSEPCPLAAGYARVSTETQLDGLGMEIQRDAIADLATAEGLTLAEVFVDEGICGAEGLDTRRGLAAALDWLTEHPGATLIIPRLDRLARDLMVQEQVLADAWKCGATVLSCSETERTYCRPDSPDDPARTLIRQVLGAVAAYERQMIRLRLVKGRRRRIAEQGYAGGPDPYGWRCDDERAVLAHVQARRARGASWQQIADELNAGGHHKRNGRAWTPQSLQKTHARAALRTPIEPELLILGQAALI